VTGAGIPPFNDTLFNDTAHVWHPFTQTATADPPVAISHAKGAELITEDGRIILDLISSWWVTLHGHAQPEIAAAIAEQAKKLEQVIFAGFTHAPATELARRIAHTLPGNLSRVFFSDDGSTSVEVALKLARQYWHNLGHPNRKRFLAFEGGYHGDTVGAMSVGTGSGFHDVFTGMTFPVDLLPYPETWIGDADVEAKEHKALAILDTHLETHTGEIAAVIIEPLIQGAGGMRMCRPEFLQSLSQRLTEHNVLMIFDEVMVGFGRTGPLFACDKANVVPDIICLSKGLTGGFLPLSLTVCSDDIFDAFSADEFDKAFAHGHSFGANPLGCAAALASLDLLETPGAAPARARIEAKHVERITNCALLPDLIRPRIAGTIAAIDFTTDDAGYGSALGPALKSFFLERDLLLRPLGNVVYLLPPYCTTNEQLDRAYDAIEEAAVEFAGQKA
jgi:adenosylmethionine-8-amino-7-oxononanoate aminotransferase